MCKQLAGAALHFRGWPDNDLAVPLGGSPLKLKLNENPISGSPTHITHFFFEEGDSSPQIFFPPWLLHVTAAVGTTAGCRRSQDDFSCCSHPCKLPAEGEGTPPDFRHHSSSVLENAPTLVTEAEK